MQSDVISSAMPHFEQRKVLKSGNVVVIWGAPIQPKAEQNSGIVLMYYLDVPEKGGIVCYQDGQAAVLTKDEFEKARKAKPPENVVK